MKNIENDMPKTIIVTKDNFQSSLEDYKNHLKNKSLEYIIINNEISTSNPKILETEGEIVFSEFTICYSFNNRTNLVTYLVPSIKFHRFSPDEIASFDSIFLSNENNIHNFKHINKLNTLSYENINRRSILENNLKLILKDGKLLNDEKIKEKIKSYNYFPKAIEIPSKEFQKKFEDRLKYFIKQNFDVNSKKIFGTDNDQKDKNIYSYESNIYEINYKLLNRLLNFKWGLIYENYDPDAYKLIVDGLKINLLKQKDKLRSNYIDFIEYLIGFFCNKDNESKEFEIIIKKNNLDEEFFKNWKQYLLLEDEKIELKYEFFNENEKQKVKFKLTAEKQKTKIDQYENIIKFLSFIIKIKHEYQNKNEFELNDIDFKRFNMKNLIPKKVHSYFKFSYHIRARIDFSKFKLNKNVEYYLSKISYKNLLIHNKSDEEILFGYKIGEKLKELFEIKDKLKVFEKEEEKSIIYEDRTKEISLQFERDLEILLNNKYFDIEIKKYFSKLDFSASNSENDKCRIRIVLIKKPDFTNNEFIEYFDTLLNIAKNIKKNNLLKEEIGVTYFYKYLFDKENINIYGTNLKNKIYFPIKQLLLDVNKDKNNEEEEIKQIINKVNIYDISYICMKTNFNLYNKYLDFKNDDILKNLTMTQKLGYIIQKNKILKNRDDLNDYRNKFYADEKEKVENKLYIDIDKNKFYEKTDDIMNILKKKTDFTINDNSDKSRKFRINFIDPEKFNEIKKISKKINNI